MVSTVLLEFTVRADPADAEQVIAETLRQTVAFAGNEGITAFTDGADERRRVVIETWTNPNRYDAYLDWRATLTGGNRPADITDGPPSVRRLTHHLDL